MIEQELLSIVETLKEFKGMLWEQQIIACIDHKNLMQDALGLTSDRVYHWRLLLEENGPTIMYIKGIHNTVVDTIYHDWTMDLSQMKGQSGLLLHNAGVITTQHTSMMKPKQTQKNPWTLCSPIQKERTLPIHSQPEK